MIWVGYLFIIIVRTMLGLIVKKDYRSIVILRDVTIFLIPNIIALFYALSQSKQEVKLFVWLFSGYLLFSILILCSCILSSMILKIYKKEVH